MSVQGAGKRRMTVRAAEGAHDPDVIAGLLGGPELPCGAAPLSTKEGWRELVDLPGSVRPQTPTLARYRAADSAWRQDFDELRLAHIGNFGPIQDVYTMVHEQAVRVWRLNCGRKRGLNYGAAIDGSPANGKTTALQEIGRTIEAMRRAGLPGVTITRSGGEFIPVVYVSLHEKPTTKNFNKLLLHFYGHPARGSADTGDLTDAVTELIRRCATTLVLVDDIHFLDFRRKDDTDTNNHLKKLINECRSTTFLYAGVDLVENGWLVEGKGRRHADAQTAGRMKRLPAAPFVLDRDNCESSQRWQSLLATFESELVLLDAQPGDVYFELAEYVHVRTGGKIGPISQLLREGAFLAVEYGQERITEALLDEIVLDDHSETASELKSGRPGGGRRARDPRRGGLDAQRSDLDAQRRRARGG
jgi:hypothetical protein